MKSSVTKGNYDELLHSIEREYYNSDLNKLVEPADLGLDEEAAGPFRKETFFHSPLSKKGPFARRDSFAHSPFKALKSPGSYLGAKNLEDNYLEEEESDRNFFKRNIRKYFEQPEDYTIGEIFAEIDYPQANHKKETLAEPAARNMNVEQQYSRYMDDSAYKSAGTFARRDDDAGARCSRGLKVLSVKVRDIVYQKRQTSYKEVAEALINDGSFEVNFTGVTVGSCSSKNKKKKAREEQNVKRRVYDALNVLIAAEVLRKSAKMVYFNEMDKGIGRNLKNDKHELQKKLAKTELSLSKKKQNLQSMVQKLMAIHTMIKRNRSHEIPDQPNPVKFPFMLIVPAPGQDTVVDFEMQPSYKKLLLQSNKELTVYGDIEVLILLSMHLQITKPHQDELLSKYFEKDRQLVQRVLEEGHPQPVAQYSQNV